MNDSNLLWMHGPYNEVTEGEEQGICRPPNLPGSQLSLGDFLKVTAASQL